MTDLIKRMRQDAIIVIRDGARYACVTRSEACARCRACDLGKKEEVLLPVSDEYAPGEKVVIEMEEGRIAGIAALMYGIPLLALLIALFIAEATGASEWLTAVAAIAACALSFIGVKYAGRKVSGKHGEPRVIRKQ